MFTEQNIKNKNFAALWISILCGAIFLMIFSSNSVSAQDLKSILFMEVTQVQQTAKKENADIMSPHAYSRATASLVKAETAYQQGKSLTEIRKLLGTAVKEFQDAIFSTKVANTVLSSAVQARHDALTTEANLTSQQLWTQAENKFKQATGTLEDGSLNNAKRLSVEAEKLYRDAELQSIKSNYLQTAYSLIEEARNLNARRYAPTTFQKAQDLVKQAENELNENRYDTDRARILARQARQEARHTIYLATAVRAITETNKTWEDILLASEVPLMRIARGLDFSLTFESGFNKSTEDILKVISEYRTENRRMRASTYDAIQLTNLLRARNEELQNQVGAAEKEKSVLARTIEEQEKIQERYTAVEKIFTSEEALLFREASDLRIRLTGLSFPVGRATIETKYYPFLSKVIQAIRLFPNASITIEGHTDSFGNDETNYKLSDERARSVMTYILGNMAINQSMVDVVGYGETKPIATNETEEGRARNRRIAVVIHPNLGGNL